MGIKALSGEWFYDDLTPRGVSFDGLLPQACKTPLGNMKDFELIHSPANMADFQNNYWHKKNPSLGEILLTVAPLESHKHEMIDHYKMKVENILSGPCDSDDCHYHVPSSKHTSRGACRGMSALRKDFSRYEKMLPSLDKSREDGKLYDVKKEIYRLTDRVIAGLAKRFGIRGNGAFEILDELGKKRIITSNGSENLASAAAIALKLRISTYLEAGKQGEQMRAKSSEEESARETRSFYHLPSEEELFHFFFIATPLYDELRRSFLLDENITESFPQQAFFNCSDAVKGHIYCRILKYDEALQCYERALELNPENIELELRQIDVQLAKDRSAETAILIEYKLEALLRRMCKKCNLPDGVVDRRGHYIPKVDGSANSLQNDDACQLLDILCSIYDFHVSQGNFDLAGKIFDQCMSLGNAERDDEFKLSLMNFAFLEMCEQLDQEQSERVTSVLNETIEEEGISTCSIVYLNELGSYLSVQGKYEQAYQSLQRALTMERTLYGSNFNPQVKTTLTMLGVISVRLRMYEEGKIYYEQLLHLCESLSVPGDRMLIREAHLCLAFLCAQTNRHEEAISNFQEVVALLTSGTYERESLYECVTHCQIATSWHALDEKEKALKSALDAKECLTSIAGVEMRVDLTCAVAEAFAGIGRHEEAILLIKNGLEELDAELDLKHKAEYLKFLGEISVQQGLASDAERYYKEAVEILMINKENTSAIVDCLLELCSILLEKGESSDVRSKLDEAWKYASNVTDDSKMCIYIRKIGECWEKLGDVNEARNWYDDALASSVLINFPLFEFDLLVKLGDLTKLYLSSTSINSDISVSLEQSQKAQRIHYDRAGKVLRRHSSSGNVNFTTIQRFVALASRYSSIDSAEEEKLLFDALKISDAILAADTTCEIVAGILTGLSDIKWFTGDYVSASDFLEHSLKMEMELHSSDRYHPHIPELLYRLSRLHLKNTGREQLGEAIQRVLEFLEAHQEEEVFPNTVAKENAAVCFLSMRILYLSLEDVKKANSALEMANKIFEEIREDNAPKDKALHTITRETSVQYPKFLNNKELVSTVLIPLFFPYATELLLDELSLTAENLISIFSGLDTYTDRTEVNTHGEPQERLSDTNTHSPNPKIATLLSAADSFRPYLCTTKNNGSETTTAGYDEKQCRDIESFQSKIDSLSVLAESVNCDLKKGNIQLASKTINDFFDPFVVSLFEQHCPGDIEPAEFLINEALKAKENYGTMMMLVYLNLADKFPSKSQRKAKISKLRGECNLSQRNYRIAAISFFDAAGFFCMDTTSDPDAHVEHIKVLIDLAKSHVLCNDVESAWIACQDGLGLISTLESGAIKSRLKTELFLLGAKCLIHLGTEDREFDKAVSFCQQGLAASKLMGCSTRTELWEFFALNYGIQKLLVTALSRLNKLDDSRKMMEKMIEFLRDIADTFEMTSDGTATDNDDVESLEISRRLYSWMGQALVISGEANDAVIWLTKSLSAFFALGLPNTIPAQEEFLALLDAITATKAVVPQVDHTPFEQTIEFCMQKLQDQDDDFNVLLTFFEILGELYVDRGRDEEAIMLYERALAVVECMGNSNDAMDIRVMIIVYLAHSHRREAMKNTKKSTAEECSLAEKYYQTGLKMTGDFAICKVSYASYICDQGRFAEASKVLEEVAAVGQTLWDMQITCPYSSRIIYCPTVKRYIEDHGELVTTAGILAYSTLVRAFVGMGKKREAVAACEKLSMNGEEIEIFTKRPPFMQCLLGACHKALLSLVDDQSCLQFQNVVLPMSGSNLAKLYRELGVYEPTLEYCEKFGSSAAPLSSEPAGSLDSTPLTLSSSCLYGNALVELGKVDESHPFFINFLELLQSRDGILDKPFDTQKAILAQYSFANQYYVYDALGTLMSRRGNTDGAIECYEHCLDLDEDFSFGQDVVATLAELYQVKALTTRSDDKYHTQSGSYTKWMNTAQACFEKLRQKTTKLTPFLERAVGSFLCRQERFIEAIPHFKNVLEDNDETVISFSGEDKPLVSVYLEREIEARGEIDLPLKIFVYYEVVCAYLKLNEVQNAQESVLQMEKHVALFESDPDYPLILSVLGYTHKEIENRERAVEIFVSVLEINPGHAPVTVALETCH